MAAETRSEAAVSGAEENPTPVTEKTEGRSEVSVGESVADDASTRESSQEEEEPVVTFKTWIVVFVCVCPPLQWSRFRNILN